MNLVNKKNIFFIPPLIFFVGIILFFIQNFETPIEKHTTSDAFYDKSALLIANSVVNLEIADTLEKRIQGLSGRDRLNNNHGLLFVFEKPDFYGIWMKEMKFAIDIIWLDENLSVVDFKKSITPETFPEVFYPVSPALYVLELNAGFLDENPVKIGDLAELK